MLSTTESRRDATLALTKASTSYLVKQLFSVYVELGISRWGSLRADVIALNHKRQIVIVEVKSSIADYTSDHKWERYLEFCNKMYFAFDAKTYEQLKSKTNNFEPLRRNGVGVLVLDPNTGYLSVKLGSKRRPMAGANKRDIVTRMAWRGGTSRRNSRRVRQFLE